MTQKPIDFDTRFRRYLSQWMRENADKYADADELEAAMPAVYERFTETPAPWLDGRTPIAYFQAMDDPEALIALLRAYEDAGIAEPDLLTDRLLELGERAISPLLALLRDAGACACLRVTALNLLAALAPERAAQDCLDLIDRRERDDALADAAAELLEGLGEAVVEPMSARLPAASPAARCTYLDLLCNFPGSETIYTYTVHAFLNDPDMRALYASYLGKLGDARAIEPLKRVMAGADINYLDYMEIANAIEMLGGDPGDRDRAFDGDPYYESLKLPT